MKRDETAEYQRLARSRAGLARWRTWGTYVPERAWGTVREDYSEDARPWTYFTHDQARSRVYRWTEDGIGGVCNQYQNLVLAVALWNEKDPYLKERFFGVSGVEGNHGEDVKELYFYLDATPTQSYAKMLYKYPQVAYPYDDLVNESLRRGYDDPEYEITEALRDVWTERRYFDVTIEWAKAAPEDLLCRITAVNRGPDPAPIHVLPHLWGRNTWSWGYDPARPELRAIEPPHEGVSAVHVAERHIGERWWYVAGTNDQAPVLLFTENDTNQEKLFGTSSPSPYVRDAFHATIVDGESDRVNPDHRGTKTTGHVQAELAPGESLEVYVRFSDEPLDRPFDDLADIFETRIAEADAYYDTIHSPNLDAEHRLIQRQAWAGLIWTEQFYHYSVELWLDGDPAQPDPPPPEKRGRNQDWIHLYNVNVLSMPDKWEYPWFASWDTAFHTVALAMIDPDFAKDQLLLLLHEWYIHPNGQIPAYEWYFDDVNPPVHAWATWRVYHIDSDLTGIPDHDFLERAFHKLLLNFTWWVNRKDQDNNNVFQGGFLGLDNIGIFDRSKPLPTGGHIDQADGTAWMAMYCLNMLHIALELAGVDPTYEDVATKFFEHFIWISHALAQMGEADMGLWNARDGFYYDVLHLPHGETVPLKVRSLVGLIPLFAVEILDPEVLNLLPRFRERMDWFLKYRPHMVKNMAPLTRPGQEGRLLLSVSDRDQLTRVLEKMLDPDEFLSPCGIRSLSKVHAENPYTFRVNGEEWMVQYEPGVARSGLFGGNSNWRGPVWFPTNYLLIESLRMYHTYYGDDLQVEFPTGSGNKMHLSDVAEAMSRRMVHIYLKDEEGRRRVYGEEPIFRHDEHAQDLLLFYEYFHGDTAEGLGASHQTGWTALVAKLIDECYGGETCVSDASADEDEA